MNPLNHRAKQQNLHTIPCFSASLPKLAAEIGTLLKKFAVLMYRNLQHN